MKNKNNRRTLIKLGGLGSLGLFSRMASSAVPTPTQTEGPFYPVMDQRSKNQDLTRLEGSDKVALGQVVIINGIVTDVDDKPLSGAVIDMWQACASGKYSHPGDPNPAPLDPDFQYFARLITDNEGKFSAKTVIPGSYQATPTWERPPHIHFRVDAWGKNTLTTQMYFGGQSLNAADNILQAIPADQRASVIVDFSQANAEGIPTGTFRICVS